MKIKRLILWILAAQILVQVLYSQNPVSLLNHEGRSYFLYPYLYDECPDIPSPLVAQSGLEYLIGLTPDNKHTIIPVTIENGEPLDYLHRQWYGKGNQLEVDSIDFPTLAKTGLHSLKELNQIKTITGKPVSEITRDGLPGQYSGSGFISKHENLISVLKGDNILVAKMGLIHPELAQPLYHVFNLILVVKRDSDKGTVKAIKYNNKIVDLKFWGAKGWQNSIFNDEILGYWQIEMGRNLTEQEVKYLRKVYPRLTEEEFSRLIKKLSFIHTGEMIPYYIMRYGFYEGHTDYRADPIAISFIFGYKSIKDIEDIFPGTLDHILKSEFISTE